MTVRQQVLIDGRGFEARVCELLAIAAGGQPVVGAADD